MSVNVIVQPHPFKSNRLKVSANSKPICEIIKDLNTGFPLSQARVSRNGEIITDFSLIANDGDTLWIKFVPYGTNEEIGTGMKIGGWALAAVGVAIGVIAGWTGIGAFFGAALIGTGLSMALGGQVLLNTEIPPLTDREKPDNDPSIRGAKNQARPHGRIPVLFGRHRIYPDIAANPHTSIIGNQQCYTQLFCGGYKDYEIDLSSIKLGETPLVDFSQTKNINAILAGADPFIKLEILQNGETSSLYPHCVHEEVLNFPLQNEIEDADGNKIPNEIIKTTPNNTDKINIDIFFHNGIGRYNDDGGLVSASVTVNAWYKLSTEENYILFWTENVTGNELKTMRRQITLDNLKPGQYNIKIVRTTPDSTDSKIIDTVHLGSIRSFKTIDKDGNPLRPIRAERQKDLTIIALRVLATAKLNGVIDSFNYVATSVLPVHSPNGSGPLYWLNAEKTRNPASMLMYALRGRAAQQTVEENDIDWTSIEDFYAWCEEHEYTCNSYLSEAVTIAELIRMIGSTSRAEILRIDSKIAVVQDIERPAPVQLFTPKNTVSYSVTMFQADVPDAISLRFIDEEAGFAHNELPVHNTPDGNRDAEPDTIQKVDLWGITDSVQVRRIGMYNYACIKNRPFVHSIEVDIEYLLCNKGDWIQYAGDIALTGSVQGRIKGLIFADGVCIGIDTDEPVVMTEGQQHAVRIRLTDGTIIFKEVVFNMGIPREKAIAYYPVEDESNDIHEPSLGDMYVIDEFNNVYYEPQNVIYFIEPISINNILNNLKAGGIYAFGVRGYEALDLIITDLQPGANLTASLTCVEYSPEIFDVDKPDFILPEFINRITPVSGAIDSGVVNPVNWQRFVIYHDSEEQPPRPAGDGQDDGWYREQNFRSLWQSTKIAENMESGEWGLPQRINARRGTDDITPVWLSLDPQNITLETDGDGNVLTGLLPATAQARLFQWNSLLNNVIFSLQQDAPEGIKIDSNGIITISETASLDDENSIRVSAEHNGSVYTAVLLIKKNIRNFPARYLGTIMDLSKTATVTIIKGPVQGQVTARQGDFVLLVAAVDGRQAGSVMQWTGKAWEIRSPDTHADLYMRSFKDGLDVPELTQDMGWFGSVFARLIVAQQAFIENLSAQMIKLHENGGIRSENFREGDTGFSLQANGRAVFNEELYAYSLKVVSFEIVPPTGSGTLIANLIGFQSQELSLSIGWYEVEMAGGGGAGALSSEGGYLKHRFYNSNNNISIKLQSGGGGMATNGGGGGGGSVVEILALNIILIAGGGGGGGVLWNGAGGGGGANGGGGGGGGPSGGAGGGGGGASGGAGGVGTSGTGTTGKNGLGFSGGDGGQLRGYGGEGGYINNVMVGGRGYRSSSDTLGDSTKGGYSINDFVVSNTGGGNNANGGNGYIKLKKLS